MKELVIPVLSNVDYANGRLREIIDFADEIVILGTTGEGHLMSMDNCQQEILKWKKFPQINKSKLRIGIIRKTIEEDKKLIDFAIEHGINKFMIGAPDSESNNLSFWSHFYSYFTNYDFLAYNRPELEPIHIDTFKVLLEEGISGIKDSSGNLYLFKRLVDLRTDSVPESGKESGTDSGTESGTESGRDSGTESCPQSKFALYSGSEKLFEDIIYDWDFNGLVSGYSNIHELAYNYNKILKKEYRTNDDLIRTIKRIKSLKENINKNYGKNGTEIYIKTLKNYFKKLF